MVEVYSIAKGKLKIHYNCTACDTEIQSRITLEQANKLRQRVYSSKVTCPYCKARLTVELNHD